MQPITDAAILGGYLRDASNLVGRAEALYRPESAEEVAQVVARCQRDGIPLTVVAKQTSTTGASVPEGGAILSTERLARIHAADDVEAGVFLGQYQDRLAGESRAFPPDPTSRHECSLGGAIACNASGARTFRYGPTRRWIAAAEVVLPTGEVVVATRETPCPWPVPRWREPGVKSAAGYSSADNLLDLVIGSEGTLGVVTRARTLLVDAPRDVATLLVPVPDRERLHAMLPLARALSPLSIEYLDGKSLDLARERLGWVPRAASLVAIEVEGAGDGGLDPWGEVLAAAGAEETATVVADDAGLRRLAELRHVVPAMVNERIARAGVHKVGTDFAVPDAALPAMMEAYDAVPMDTVCFGHLGQGHLHLNLLPRDAEELGEAKRLYRELARTAVALGGTVSAEHGIGRLKKALLADMVGAEVVAGWRAMRRAADPAGILGRGVLVDP